MKRDPFSNVPLNALRAFECLARRGSHSAAASELGVTVSALSHQLKKLEQHVGAALIISSGRRLALTPVGEELAAAVGDGFSRVRDGLSRIGKVRPLTLAVCPLFAAALLAPRWDTLEVKAGDCLELSLAALPQPSQTTDAAVCLRAGTLSDHNSIEVFAGAAVPVATPAIRNLVARMKDAPPWLVCTRWDDAVTQWRGAAGSSTQPDRTIRAEGLSALYAACVRGMGLAILPIDLIREELEAGVLVEVFPEAPRLSVAFALHFSSNWLHVDRMRRLARTLSQAAQSTLAGPDAP